MRPAPPRPPHPSPGRGPLGWGLGALTASVVMALAQGAGGTAFFRDRLYYFLPQYAACRDALADGLVPLWNPYLNCGQPLLASLQVAVGSPLAMPFLLLPYGAAENLFWVLALGLAASAMYALGLRSGLPAPAAAVAAVVYAGSGPLRSLGEWPNIVASLAYLPLLLLALGALCENRPGGFAGVAVSVALVLVSGQPRQTLILGLTAAAWTAAVGTGPRPRGPFWIRLAGAVALGAGVAAIQLLPSAELYGQSARRLAGVQPATVDESFLAPLDLLTILLPLPFGNENAYHGASRLLMPELYVGPLGLILAATGLARRGSRVPARLLRFSWLAVPIALLPALGRPVYHAMSDVTVGPGALRYAGHLVLVAFPALALLAGAGAAELLRRPRATPAPWNPRVVSFLALAAILPWVVATGPDAGAARLGAALSVLGAAAGLLALRAGRTRLLMAILTLDLLQALHGYEAKADGELFAPPPALARIDPREGRIFSPVWLEPVYPKGGEATVQAHYRARHLALYPNLPQVYRLENATGYEPFELMRHRKWFEGWWKGPRRIEPALRLAGVRFAIAPDSKAPGGWTRAQVLAPGFSLWEVPDPLPPVTIRPRRRRAAADWTALLSGPSPGRARVIRRAWNEVLVETEAHGTDAALYLASPWYPGWRASVDGERERVGEAAGLLQAVPVPPGRHRVSLSYVPVSFAAGAWISAVSLGLLLALPACLRRIGD